MYRHNLIVGLIHLGERNCRLEEIKKHGFILMKSFRKIIKVILARNLRSEYSLTNKQPVTKTVQVGLWLAIKIKQFRNEIK